MPFYNIHNFEIAKLVLKANPLNSMPIDRLLITPEWTFVTDGHFCVRVSTVPSFDAASYPDRLGPVAKSFDPFTISATEALDFLKKHKALNGGRPSPIPILNLIVVLTEGFKSPALASTDLESDALLPSSPNAPAYLSPDRILQGLSSFADPVPSISLDPKLLVPLLRQADSFRERGEPINLRWSKLPDSDPAALALRSERDGQIFEAHLANFR